MTQMETISTLPRIGTNIWRVGGREGAETERHRETGSQREKGEAGVERGRDRQETDWFGMCTCFKHWVALLLLSL